MGSIQNSPGTSPLVLQHLRAGEFKQAEAAVDKVRKQAPNNPLADYLAGLIELAQNAPDKARTAFEKALAKKPGDPGTHSHPGPVGIAEPGCRDGAAALCYARARAGPRESVVPDVPGRTGWL